MLRSKSVIHVKVQGEVGEEKEEKMHKSLRYQSTASPQACSTLLHQNPAYITVPSNDLSLPLPHHFLQQGSTIPTISFLLVLLVIRGKTVIIMGLIAVFSIGFGTENGGNCADEPSQLDLYQSALRVRSEFRDVSKSVLSIRNYRLLVSYQPLYNQP